MGKSNSKQVKLATIRAQGEVQNATQKKALVLFPVILFGICFVAAWLVYCEFDTFENAGSQGFDFLDAIEGYKGHKLQDKQSKINPPKP